MSDDLLRLRTARALGWDCIDGTEIGDGVQWQMWMRKGLSEPVHIGIFPDGHASYPHPCPLPAYGTTWASCEEIDAACKERGWTWEADGPGDSEVVVIPGWPKPCGRATAPTFPAAFALAFCEAVEAGRPQGLAPSEELQE